MKRFKKNTGKNLYQLNKVRREAQVWEYAASELDKLVKKYRKDLEQAYLDGIEADHKRKIANAENGYCWSLIEYLKDYALQSQSIEEMNEWKEKFKQFNESQWMKFKQESEELQTIDVSIFGRHIVKKIYC
jgi:hypothetical protein